ncbi:MAG: DUF4870 domain-containing protein [Planctomycetes bacterium]|nr:DUF4870 domain-containing protein [Planctomycetota bacterium]
MSNQGQQEPTGPQAEHETQGPPQEAPAPPPAAPGVQGETTWAMFAHLAALAGFTGVLFGNIIGPLVVWLIKKDTMPLVDEHGKESLNFQISMAIYAVVAALFAVVAALFIFVRIGMVLLAAIAIVDLVFLIIAAIKAHKGEAYRYPLTIRLIK